MRAGARSAALRGLVVAAALCSGAVAQDGGTGRSPQPTAEARVDVDVTLRTGTTLVSAGEPIVGAWVAEATPGLSPQDLEAGAVATDPAGRALVSVRAPGGVVLAWARGSAPAAFWGSGPLSTPVVLGEGASLEVSVRDAEGRPASGASVDVVVPLPVSGAPAGAPQVHEWSVRGVTDEHGAVTFLDLPRVALRVRAESAGAVAPEVFPAQAGAAPLVLALQRGADVEGRAIVVPGGVGAEGARLTLGGRSARVGANGAFAFRAVLPGTASLESADGDLLLREPVTLVLHDGERRAGVEVTLMRTSALSALVLGADAREVPTADVTLVWPVLATPWSGARRDFPGAVTDGRLRLDRLPPAEGVSLEVRAPGHAPLVVEGVSLPAGAQPEPLTVRLRRGARLSGQIVAASGAYLAGVRVEARRPGDAVSGDPADATTTGPGGLFVLDALPAARVLLRVVPPPGSPFRVSEFGPFVPGAEQAERTGPLVLSSGHALRGAVSGAPADAQVVVSTAGGRDVLVDLEDGAFEVEGLGIGDAHVEVSSPTVRGGARATVRLPAGWPLDLDWRPAEVLDLRVLGPGDAPVTRVSLLASPADLDASAVALEGGDLEGHFRLEVEPGTWHVAARAGDLVGSLMCVVSAGGGTHAVLRLARGETVTGEVADRQGSFPLEGARVEIVPLGGGQSPVGRGVTDARGGFRVSGVVPGVVQVRVEAPGHAPFVSRPLPVQRAAALDVGRIELARGRRLEGLVLGATGTVVRGARVSLTLDEGGSRAARTDLQGRFTFDNLPPGGAVIDVGGAAQRVWLDAGSEPVEVVVDLGFGTEIIGLVRRDARPVPYCEIRAWTLAGSRFVVTGEVDGRGEFRLPPLPPGPVRVAVLAPGASLEHVVDVDLPRASDHSIEIDLPDGGLRGTVIDRLGNPVAGAALTAWAVAEDGTLSHVVAEGVSEARGEFSLEGVAAGVVEIEGRRAGHGIGWSEQIRLPGRGTAIAVDVRLTEEARVSVELVDGRSRPVAGAWLSVEPAPSPGATARTRVRAGVDGIARLDALAPGDWLVTVGGPGRGQVSLGLVRLRPGPNALGRFALEEGGTLRVTAVLPAFFPAPGVDVVVLDLLGRDPRPDVPDRDRPLAPPGRQWRTGADGTLLVPDLAPGIYRVRAALTPASAAVLVRVSPGDVAEVSVWAPFEASQPR